MFTRLAKIVAVFALVIGSFAVTVAFAQSASADDDKCDLYGAGSSGDMPTDPGSTPMPATDCPPPKASDSPSPHPPNTPEVHPTHEVQPSAAPSHTPAPVEPSAPATTGTTDYNPPAPAPVSTPSSTPQKAKPPKATKTPKVHQHTKPQPAKPETKSQEACPTPVVASDYQFPWLLVGLGMLLAALAGGVATTRAYMATGHRWPPRIRRIVAGPDHTRIDA